MNTLLKEIPPDKQSIIFSRVRKAVARHIKLNKPEFDMKERIKSAIKNNILAKEYAKFLLFKINSIEESKEFQKEWSILAKKWRNVYYGKKGEKAYFHFELISAVAYEVFKILWLLIEDKDKVLRISRRFKNKIGEFLEKWRIDGVVDGKPLIDLYLYKSESSFDLIERPIVIFKVPFLMSVENFRRVIGGEYGKAKKQFYEIAANVKFPKQKWGERTGTLDYYLSRNMKIFEKYLELKPFWRTKDKTYEEIHKVLGLERDMDDAISIKPIIRKFVRSGKK